MMCTFFLGMDDTLERLGVAHIGGWDQPVLDASGTQDYLLHVIRAIHVTKRDFDAYCRCYYTWHDATLWARAESAREWKRLSKVDRARIRMTKSVDGL